MLPALNRTHPHKPRPWTEWTAKYNAGTLLDADHARWAFSAHHYFHNRDILTPTLVAYLLVTAERSDPFGYHYGTLKFFAHLCGCSKASVQNVRKLARDHGWLRAVTGEEYRKHAPKIVDGMQCGPAWAPTPNCTLRITIPNPDAYETHYPSGIVNVNLDGEPWELMEVPAAYDLDDPINTGSIKQT